MKKSATIRNNSSMFWMGLLLVMGLLWSCAEEEYNPGIQAPVISEIGPTAAFPGMEVTIYGKNFSSAAAGNAVSFNGTAATVASSTTLAVTAIVPEGATTGDVTVTTNNLTSNSLPFTVTIPVIPTITSIEPDIGKVGTIVIITGTDFSTVPDENTVSFNGTDAVVTESTATSITTSVPSGAESGNVTVTVDGESNGVMFTVTLSSLMISQINDEADDAEEGENGRMANESSDLELGRWDEWTQDEVPQGVQTIGVKFNDITIPPVATILAATIQFTADQPGSDPVQLTIYGENVGNPKSYTDKDVPLPDGTVDILYDISLRPRTTASAIWDVPSWEKGDAGPAQQTVDLGPIVQEIVNREDWVSGNSIAFILVHSGPSETIEPTVDGREAEAGPGSDAAILTVAYDE